MKSLRRLWPYMQPYRWQALAAIVLIVGMVVVDLAIPRLTQDVIDKGIAQRDLRLIVTTSLLMLVASLVSAGFAIGNTLISVRVSQDTAADIRSALVGRVQSFSFGNLDHFETGQLLTRTTSDVLQVQTIVMMSLRMLVRAPLWILGSVAMLLINTPQMAWIMAVLMPIILVIIVLFVVRGRPMFLTVQRRLEALNQVMQENLAGIRVVKAFVRADHEAARFGQANDELMRTSVRVLQLMSVLMPTMSFTINLATAGAVWFGGQRVIGSVMTMGQLLASFNYLIRALFPLMMLASLVALFAAGDASAERILEILDNQPQVPNAPTAQLPPDVRGEVVFQQVSFNYDGADSEEVLRGIDLRASPGETVAILGATGSGKSSLVHLIPRFYDVTGGRITLDGVDVRDIPLHQLRQSVALALQEAVLFSGTIRDNIRFGRPEASDQEVEEVARAAQAHDFITSLPQGYDSMVGQRGVNLSGGQKQRLAIARALLMRPAVLVLDDSTSAVDVETEVEIERALRALRRDRTSLIIAQRISTVLNADKIVVLDQGRIAASGTHAELLSSSPIYREIYESQLGNGEVQHG
jgi:ATP-binding cassette subfamily B protein